MPSSREIDELRRKYYTLPELLKMGWIIFKANIGTLLIIIAGLYLPLCIVQELIQKNLDVIQTSINISHILTSRELLSQFLQSSEGGAIFLLTFTNTLIELLVAPVLVIAVAKLTQSFIYEKDTTNPGIFISFALSKLHIVILCNFVYSLLVGFGFLLFIIPGILILTSLYFINYAISLSNRRGLSSLKHSYLLTRGRKFRVFAYGLTFFIMKFVISYFVQFLFLGNQDQFVPMIIMRYVIAIITTFFTVSISIWYLNIEFTGMVLPYSEDTVSDE